MPYTTSTPPKCANCQIAIRWRPTIVNGKFYCCLGCAEGGPCTCDYSRLPKSGEVQAIVLRQEMENKWQIADSG